MQTPRECGVHRFGVALCKHHRNAKRGLQLHLLPAVYRRAFKRRESLARPTVALREQRELKEKLSRRSGQIRGEAKPKEKPARRKRPNRCRWWVTAVGEAPLQSCPHIGQVVCMGEE